MNDAGGIQGVQSHRAIEKVPSHIAGVDTILRGGLPKGRMTLLSGGPGTGKTIFATEFLYRSALDGVPGIFVAFEERADAIRANAATLGWEMAPLEEAGKLYLFQANVDPRTIVAGDFNFQPLLTIIEEQSRAMGAQLIVFDAIDVPLRLFAPARERDELYALHDWLAEHHMTSVFTAKTSEYAGGRYEFLDFMANTVIWLDQRVERQGATRRLRVVKYRGSAFDTNEYPYVIGRDGIKLLPITSSRLSHKAFGVRAPIGQTGLDAMLGGGFLTGACVLITGTSGTGKTLLASTFAKSACGRGERVLYISFEESADVLMSATLKAGIELKPCIDSGRMFIHAILPESRGAEEHLIDFVELIDTLDPAHVILDAASATRRFSTETGSFDFLVRFVNFCKEQGRTCILTNQLARVEEVQEVSGLGISSIVDTVILLRQLESDGEFIRAVLVLKSRGSNHSHQYREFRVTDKGIQIPKAYSGEGGLVAGVARQEREERDAVEARRLHHQLRAKEAEIAQLKAAHEAQASEFKARLELAESDLESMRLESDLRQRSREERARMRGDGL